MGLLLKLLTLGSWKFSRKGVIWKKDPLLCWNVEVHVFVVWIVAFVLHNKDFLFE
jgi:hypothetical protein